DRQLHADDDRLLADIEVAEAPDQPHAVELSGLLLEASDEQHLAQRRELLLLAEFRYLRRLFRGRPARCSRLGRWSIAGDGHFSPRNERGYRCGGRPPNSRNRRTAKAHGTVACAPSAAHTEHDPEKWVSVFGKRSCSTKRLERDDDSSKSHPALG